MRNGKATSFMCALGARVTKLHETAASGVEGLALLRDSAIDLAIVDIELPGRIDGVGLVREVRRDRPRLRVILTSGLPLRDPQMAAVGPFLLKPYRVDELLAMIAQTLAPPRMTG